MPRRASGPVMPGPSGEDVLVSARLGWLYLEQGHLDDAEAVFDAVLRWQPDDFKARAGLERVRQARIEGARQASATDGASSARRRKVARLEAFLARLRQAR